MACLETQGTRTNMSLLATSWCRKWIRKHGNQQLISKDLVSQRIQKKNHEGRWLGIFQSGRKKSAHLGKMTKRKTTKRWVWKKKWNLEVLEKERTKVSLLGRPIMGKSARGFLKKEPQKKKIMKNEEGTNHQCCWHNIGSRTQGSKWRESMVPQKL